MPPNSSTRAWRHQLRLRLRSVLGFLSNSCPNFGRSCQEWRLGAFCGESGGALTRRGQGGDGVSAALAVQPDQNDVAQSFAKAQVAQLAMEQGSPLDAATERLNASQPMLGVAPVTNHFAVREWREWREWRESVDAALSGIGLGSPKVKTA